jgi:TRAP transporter TAXI family solute receptor
MTARACGPRVARWLMPCAVILLAGVTAAATTELGLITGGEGGTYYQIGQDLKRLLKPRGIELAVHPSNGAVDNIYAVSQRPAVQLAIVQSDVLAFVAEQPSNPTLARIARGIRLVFPLFDEEVHVLARRELDTFDALAGKRVAIGKEGSGTYLTARLLFKRAGIVPGELVAIDGGDALAELKAGRLDAMIAVIGQPVGRFRDDVKLDDGLALVPLTAPAIVEAYTAAEIPAGTYAWQPTAVSTVAVKALLVAYDARGRECERIGRFAQRVAAGMDWLAKNGHPQWRRVDLERSVKGWEQYDCVRKYVGRPDDGDSPAASAGDRNPVADAINDALRNR